MKKLAALMLAPPISRYSLGSECIKAAECEQAANNNVTEVASRKAGDWVVWHTDLSDATN